jgi:hypothetical protein
MKFRLSLYLPPLLGIYLPTSSQAFSHLLPGQLHLLRVLQPVEQLKIQPEQSLKKYSPSQSSWQPRNPFLYHLELNLRPNAKFESLTSSQVEILVNFDLSWPN